jgi:enoyl-CoA hydratase/carnithine racemase
MFDETAVSVTRKEGVAIITLEATTFTVALRLALDRLIDQLETEPEIRAVILTGRKNVFLAGADLKEFMSADDPQVFTEEFRVPRAALSKIYRSSKVYIAAINGYCFGGGLELALACDLRVAVDEVKNLKGQSIPFIGFPEARLGIVPPLGGAYLLMQVVGLGRAKELLLTGKAVTAEHALRIGLVNAVSDKERLLETAEEMASAVAQTDPFALDEIKQLLISHSRADSFEQAQDHATESFGRCCGTGEKNGLIAGSLTRLRLNFQKNIGAN